MDRQARSYTGEWMTTAQVSEQLGLSAYKLARLLSETGVKRYKLAARDMRTWWLKADDVERLREEMQAPREASMKRRRVEKAVAS